jgi:hypothetical protein
MSIEEALMACLADYREAFANARRLSLIGDLPHRMSWRQKAKALELRVKEIEAAFEQKSHARLCDPSHAVACSRDVPPNTSSSL